MADLNVDGTSSSSSSTAVSWIIGIIVLAALLWLAFGWWGGDGSMTSVPIPEGSGPTANAMTPAESVA